MTLRRSLEDKVNRVIADAAAQIAQAVRVSFAAEVERALGAPAGRASPRVPKPGRNTERRSGRRPSVDEATVNRVFKLIEANPDLRSEELYKKSPVSAAVTKKALAILRAAKRVKTSGEKRATTYAPA